MSESKITSDDRMMIEGLIHRVQTLASQGRPDIPLIEVATQMKVEALNELDLNKEDDKKFLALCDRLVEFLKEHPDQSLLDLLKENKKR